MRARGHVPRTGPAVYRPGQPFTGHELAGLVRDGLLTRVLLDAHVARGTALTRDAKVPLLKAVLPPHLQRRGTVGRLGAAWFYGCTDAPNQLPVLVAKEARTTTTLPPGFSLHQTAFGPYDRVEHHHIMVTSPLRTCVDLALHVNTAPAANALYWLMASPHLHCPPDMVLSALSAMGKKPGLRAALARVRKVARAVERDYEPTGR